jgi:hypothetical protein
LSRPGSALWSGVPGGRRIYVTIFSNYDIIQWF